MEFGMRCGKNESLEKKKGYRMTIKKNSIDDFTRVSQVANMAYVLIWTICLVRISPEPNFFYYVNAAIYSLIFAGWVLLHFFHILKYYSNLLRSIKSSLLNCVYFLKVLALAL